MASPGTPRETALLISVPAPICRDFAFMPSACACRPVQQSVKKVVIRSSVAAASAGASTSSCLTRHGLLRHGCSPPRPSSGAAYPGGGLYRPTGTSSSGKAVVMCITMVPCGLDKPDMMHAGVNTTMKSQPCQGKRTRCRCHEASTSLHRSMWVPREGRRSARGLEPPTPQKRTSPSSRTCWWSPSTRCRGDQAPDAIMNFMAIALHRLWP